MSPSHRAPSLLKPTLVALGIALALSLLPGCDDTYAEFRVYPLRSDPIVEPDKKEEYTDPDRPGQFPLFAVKDLDDQRNPLYVQRDGLLKGNKVIDPRRLKKVKIDDEEVDLSEELDTVLTDIFGTPARPKVDLKAARVPNDLVDAYSKKLGLSGDTLAEGSRLYRQHCLQCHGLTGDGRGPTSKWVNPHPRDYRQGLFKFTSVDQSDGKDRRPLRADLFRTLQHGVEGTAMPAFNLLTESELDALVSYVIHLSLRGYAEYKVLKEPTYSEEKGFLVPNAWKNEGGLGDFLLRNGVQIQTPAGRIERRGVIRNEIELWYDSQDKLIVPFKKYEEKDYSGPKLFESMKRGKELFEGVDAKGKPLEGVTTCVSCHKDYGRQGMYKYDDWTTLTRPRVLTDGVYRGGRRPIDLYWRIHSGINGSGMNRFGKIVENGVEKKEGGNPFTSEQIWDLVNFVKALPYPGMREKAGIVLK